MKLLEGKTAIITGASKGIGKAVAFEFARHGCSLILLSRNDEALKMLSEQLIFENGIRCLTCKTDITKENELKDAFNLMANEKLTADILVNNAGVMVDNTLQMVKKELVETIYQTNVYGTIFASQLAIKHFIKKRKGSIINLSSIIGTHGNSGQTIYGSSKAAVIGFTKSLSKELAPLNIRVNAIAPGFIDTDMTKNMDAAFYTKNVSAIGMRRIGKPEDVAGVALFLASELSAYVTGQVIGVDGGMVI